MEVAKRNNVKIEKGVIEKIKEENGNKIRVARPKFKIRKGPILKGILRLNFF